MGNVKIISLWLWKVFLDPQLNVGVCDVLGIHNTSNPILKWKQQALTVVLGIRKSSTQFLLPAGGAAQPQTEVQDQPKQSCIPPCKSDPHGPLTYNPGCKLRCSQRGGQPCK